MKVALLSFHNACNYGAALQAYGLQKAVEQLGVECEYLDYVNDHRSHSYDMGYQIKNALAQKKGVRAFRLTCGWPFMGLRNRRFNHFYRKHLKQTQTRFRTPAELKELNAQYDKFIVGSDQVWNYVNNGRDWSYLLEFVEDDDKKISYSSSFGVSDIPEEYRAAYATLLAQFNRISTRESIGVRLIESLSGRKAHLVLDPVFLVGRKVWDEIKNKDQPEQNKSIFFYTNRQSQIQDFLDTGYETRGMKLHVLSSHLSVGDFLNRKLSVKFSMSPEQFLSEVSQAELVVTASFHCLAFAIIFHKPFVAILTGDQGKDERILNLLKITGLESRILTPQMTPEQIATPIDYENVDARLNPFLTFSKRYLNNAIFSLPDAENAPALPADGVQNERFCLDERCYGCHACEAICPVDAIQMKPDSEGFLKPTIDELLCTHCGLCHQACPVFNPLELKQNETRYFAVKNSDETRKQSSSGGVFRALSDAILKEGGAIVGALMDQDFHVKHAVVTTSTERDAMCGTFYVQSDLKNVLPQTKKMLDQERKVLFVGTPCQIHGLKLFLRKDYETLYTCDLLCHGVPSPELFSAFIFDLKKRGGLTSFQFRDKSLGWKGYHLSALINGKKISNKLWLQSFNNLFSHSVINRLSCAQCPYASYRRTGEITLGDFWGVHRTLPDFVDPLGISLVLTNSPKGEALFQRLPNLRKVEVEKEQTKQNSLLRPSPASNIRQSAFRLFRQEGYSALATRYGENNTKGYFKNMIRKLYVKLITMKR